KMENWKNDPHVKEVRAIYDEIRAGVKDNRYEIRTRNFDVESSLCSSPYPINSKSLVKDEANRVRMLKIVQVISHRELLSVERYYDTAGKLRFVYVDYGSNNGRIYLNAEGKVFWAVEQDGNKFTVGDYTNEDWQIQPSDAADAKEGFRSHESCPEVKKKHALQLCARRRPRQTTPRRSSAALGGSLCPRLEVSGLSLSPRVPCSLARRP